MLIKNRNLFRITRFILLYLPAVFKLIKIFRPDQKRLLIIKVGGIGDYILFRNFIAITVQSEKYKNYSVDLLGSIIWKELAREYDSAYIENFYFIQQDACYEQPVRMVKLGWMLFKNNYEVVLQPSYTRLLMTDGLAALTAAKQIIGFESDTESIQARYKLKTDRFYSCRLKLPPHIYFEFERNRFFFEQVLAIMIALDQPVMKFERKEKLGIVIFPGAGVEKREWGKENFLGLIKLIIQNSEQRVYLAGDARQLATVNFMISKLPPGSVVNLAGKTSLPQLIDMIGNASLVIANETSAIHIAAATKTKSVCILGGGHFERFAPYPNGKSDNPGCVYEFMECFNCNWNCKFITEANEPYPCIAKISPEAVWSKVKQLI